MYKCVHCKFDKTVDTSSSRALLYQWIIGIHRQDMEDIWHTKTDTIALRIRSPSRECCRRCFKSILLYQGLPMRTQNTETILTININQSLFLKSTVSVFRTAFYFSNLQLWYQFLKYFLLVSNPFWCFFNLSLWEDLRHITTPVHLMVVSQPKS